jgi:hypothetical protein
MCEPLDAEVLPVSFQGQNGKSKNALFLPALKYFFGWTGEIGVRGH